MRRDRTLAAALALAAATLCALPAIAADGAPAALLRARYAALAPQLEHGPFHRRLHLESAETAHALTGDAWGVVDYPLGGVAAAVTSPAHWCEALILHLNVKYCFPLARGTGTALSVAIGRKYNQPLGDAFQVELACSVAAAGPDYVEVDLAANRGPFATTNYHMTLEAIPLEPGRAFVHLHYSYDYGIEARLAMEAYLATSGRHKIGFTRSDAGNEPEPRYIGGVRGVIERNTMRYFLAIDAYLATASAPASQRFELSAERWFDDTERYPAQLHEVDRETYLAMKRREYERQQAPP